jgi:hypothetical protein
MDVKKCNSTGKATFATDLCGAIYGNDKRGQETGRL